MTKKPKYPGSTKLHLAGSETGASAFAKASAYVKTSARRVGATGHEGPGIGQQKPIQIIFMKESDLVNEIVNAPSRR
jgi:hypothetical protein